MKRKSTCFGGGEKIVQLQLGYIRFPVEPRVVIETIFLAVDISDLHILADAIVDSDRLNGRFVHWLRNGSETARLFRINWCVDGCMMILLCSEIEKFQCGARTGAWFRRA